MTDKQRQETYAQMLVRLSRSEFPQPLSLKGAGQTVHPRERMEYNCRPRGRFRLKRLVTGRTKNDGKQTPHAGTSGVHRAAYRLLPRLSGEMAWHPAGRAAFGEQQVYRWNANELDEEKWKIEN